MTENINVSIITAVLFYHTCTAPRVSGRSLDCLWYQTSRIVFVDTSDGESSNWERGDVGASRRRCICICDEFDSELNRSPSVFSGERDGVGFWTWWVCPPGAWAAVPEVTVFLVIVHMNPVYTLRSVLHHHWLYCRWVVKAVLWPARRSCSQSNINQHHGPVNGFLQFFGPD